MSLARTYWGIPSSSFEMGAIPPSPVGFASGCRGSIASHLSGLRWYSPIRPRQTHGILSMYFLLHKTVDVKMNLPGRIVSCLSCEFSTRNENEFLSHVRFHQHDPKFRIPFRNTLGKNSWKVFYIKSLWTINLYTLHNFWTLSQLNLHETDLLFRYLSHHLTWHCLLIYEFSPVFPSSCLLWS